MQKFKPMVETVKTIAIALLIAGIIGFVAGVKYEQGNSKNVVEAAKSFSTAAEAK